MEKIKESFFHNIMSVDETRVSVLMICLIGSMIFGGYMYLITGALSAIWADIITTLILAVAGINAVNAFTTSGGRFSMVKTDKPAQETVQTQKTTADPSLKK